MVAEGFALIGDGRLLDNYYDWLHGEPDVVLESREVRRLAGKLCRHPRYRDAIVLAAAWPDRVSRSMMHRIAFRPHDPELEHSAYDLAYRLFTDRRAADVMLAARLDRLCIRMMGMTPTYGYMFLQLRALCAWLECEDVEACRLAWLAIGSGRDCRLAQGLVNLITRG